MHLYFEFYNLRLDATGTKLVRVAASQDAFVVVNFPPQYARFPTRVRREPAGTM